MMLYARMGIDFLTKHHLISSCTWFSLHYLCHGKLSTSRRFEADVVQQTGCIRLVKLCPCPFWEISSIILISTCISFFSFQDWKWWPSRQPAARVAISKLYCCHSTVRTIGDHDPIFPDLKLHVDIHYMQKLHVDSIWETEFIRCVYWYHSGSLSALYGIAISFNHTYRKITAPFAFVSLD